MNVMVGLMFQNSRLHDFYIDFQCVGCFINFFNVVEMFFSDSWDISSRSLASRHCGIWDLTITVVQGEMDRQILMKMEGKHITLDRIQDSKCLVTLW